MDAHTLTGASQPLLSASDSSDFGDELQTAPYDSPDASRVGTHQHLHQQHFEHNGLIVLGSSDALINSVL
jgi:hypothetical protein